MSHDDFDIEPVRGLPEVLPKGERILWQGRPDSWALARESLNLIWVAGYFGLLALWRLVAAPEAGIAAATPFLLMGLVVCALLWLVAFVQARATVYTITTARVAMRIGAALTLTLNLPFRQIARADLDLRKNGTGTIALDLLGDTRLSFLVCWPHVRPWQFRRTQPAFRAIPDAANVARILAEAAETRVFTPEVTIATALAAE